MEDFPEANGFIGGGCANGGVIGSHYHVQDSLLVTVEVCYFAEIRVFPETELVLAETVRT